MKKILASFLALAIMMTTSGVSAYTLHILDYLAGEKYHQVDVSDCYETANGAQKRADGVYIPSGGSADFGYYIPYATRGVIVNHSGEGKIKMITDDNEYEITLDGTCDGVANYFLFRELLGYDVQLWDARLGTNTFYAERDYVEHRGEKNVRIETISGKVTINSLLFEKEKTVVPKQNILPEVSDYTLRTFNTVVVDETSSAIVVSGGLRYVDNNDPSLIPYNYNGSLYLPINTLAKAFGYYHEDMPDKSYALLRSETHEVIMLEGKYTISEGLSPEMPLEDYKAYKEGYGEKAPELPAQDVIIYHEGQTFAALRYFAELAGKTVAYNDGLVVIDDKYTVAEILKTPDFYNYINSKLSEFKKDRVAGKTYHVSQGITASDENDGSSLAPFRTLNRAASVAQAGDTVIVHGGTYRETLVPKNSGTATAPITYRAATGEKVIISATESLGHPALSLAADDEGKNIYLANMSNIDLGLGRNQIFINNGTELEMQTEARYPNGPEHLSDGRLSNAWHSKGNIYKVESGETDAITFASDTLLNQTEKDIWKGGIFVGTFGNAYTYISAEIESSEYGKFTVNDKRPKNWWWDTWALRAYKTQDSGNWYNYGCIIGAEAGMDLPGEWVRADNGYLRIKLEEGTNPNDITIEAKARQLCVDLRNKNYINIEGIDTFGGSITMRGSTMCLLNRMDMKYISHFTLTTDQRSMYIDYPYSRETANGAPQRGETGVFDGGRNNIIVNCTFDHGAGPAIYSTGAYLYIENNIINDCGYMGGYPGGIHFDTENEDKINTERGGGAIFNNEIYNAGRSCIGWVSGEEEGAYHVPASWLPMELAYNDIHDGMINTTDGGVLYTNGNNQGYDGKVTQVHHNYIYNNMPADVDGEMTSALYYDANVTGLHTYENAFFSSGGTMFNGQTVFAACDIPNTHGGRVYNNIELGHIGYDGAESLREGYFTEGKPYYAGSTIKEDKNYLYMANYNRIKNDEKRGPSATAANAELGANVTLRADGYAEFTENDQYIIFKDVDFGDGSNEMALYYTGDSNWTNDKMEIQIDNLEIHSVTALVNSPDLYQTNTSRFVIPKTTGVHDVKVTVKDYKSVCIGGISAYYHENIYKDMEDKSDKDVTNFVYISTHNDIVYNANQNDFLVVEDNYETNVAAPAYKSTWDDAILYYADEVVEADSTHLVYYGGSRAQYRGQEFKLYAFPSTEGKKTKEDLAGVTPIGEFSTNNVSFYDMTPLVFELNETLEAGTYDFYLELVKSTDKDAKGNVIKKTSNIVGFGLLKEGADLTKYGTNPRYYGRMFDAEKSVQDSEKPFYKLYGPQLDSGKFMGRLLYTMAGSEAVYTGVDVIKESTKLAVNYTADIGYDNQPVEVYIGDQLIAKFTTVGNDNDRFDTVEIPIEASYNGGKVAKGTYEVTFKFLGDREDKQTFQIFYFTFR